jgi:hypothetical protein
VIGKKKKIFCHIGVVDVVVGGVVVVVVVET